MITSYRLNGYYRWQMEFLLFSFFFPWTCPIPVETKCTLRGIQGGSVVEKGKCVQNLTCLRHHDKLEISWVPSEYYVGTQSYMISLLDSNTERAVVIGNYTFVPVEKHLRKMTFFSDEVDLFFAYDVQFTRIVTTNNQKFFTKAGCKDMRNANTNTVATDTEETLGSRKENSLTTVQLEDGHSHVSGRLSTEFHTEVDDVSSSYRENEATDTPQKGEKTSEYKMQIIVLSCVVSVVISVAILLVVLIQRRRRNAVEEKTEMIQVNANPSSSLNVVDSRKDQSNSKDMVANETEEYKQTSHTGKQSNNKKEPKEDKLQKETEYISHSRTQNENHHEEDNGPSNNKNEQKDDTYDNPNEQDNGISDSDDVYHHLSYSRKNNDNPGEQEDDTYAHAQSSEYDTFKRDPKSDESEHYSISN